MTEYLPQKSEYLPQKWKGAYCETLPEELTTKLHHEWQHRISSHICKMLSTGEYTKIHQFIFIQEWQIRHAIKCIFQVKKIREALQPDSKSWRITNMMECWY